MKKEWKIELSPAELLKFRASMRKLQEEMLELLVSTEEQSGFREANKIIDRIRKI